MARRLVVTTAQLEALQDRARLDARAGITARLEGLPQWTGLLTEGCYACLPVVLDELTATLLTAVRVAAHVLEVEPATLLAALLVGRTAVEQATGTEG